MVRSELPCMRQVNECNRKVQTFATQITQNHTKLDKNMRKTHINATRNFIGTNGIITIFSDKKNT